MKKVSDITIISEGPAVVKYATEPTNASNPQNDPANWERCYAIIGDNNAHGGGVWVHKGEAAALRAKSLRETTSGTG